MNILRENDKSTGKNQASKKEIGIKIAEYGGILAVVGTLITGGLTYHQSVQENQDNNFREIVSGLSSKEKQTRLASTSNLGTFITDGHRYYDEAIDILINMVAIETDIDVLGAIRNSLENTSIEDYKAILQKLLKLESNFFIYKNYLEEKLKASKRITNNNFTDYVDVFEQYKANSQQDKLSPHYVKLEALKNQYLQNIAHRNTLETEVKEDPFRIERITKFVISFLSRSRDLDRPVKNLKLYQNSWNYVLLTDIKLPASIIKRSAISIATLSGVDLTQSEIEDTTFYKSGFRDVNFSGATIKHTSFDKIVAYDKVNFSNVTFEDVIFLGADLIGADFSDARGLQAYQFYRAKNLDKAKFDSDFRDQLSSLNEMDDQTFIQALTNSKMSVYKQRDIKKTLNELNTE